MNCRHVQSIMSAYVDGELTGVEMMSVRRHISECKECFAEYEDIVFTKRAVANLKNTGPRPDFLATLYAKLDEETIPSYRKYLNSINSFIHRKMSPVTAALTACGLALAILSAGNMRPVIVSNNTDSLRDTTLSARIKTISYSPETLPEIISEKNTDTFTLEPRQNQGVNIELASFSVP